MLLFSLIINHDNSKGGKFFLKEKVQRGMITEENDFPVESYPQIHLGFQERRNKEEIGRTNLLKGPDGLNFDSAPFRNSCERNSQQLSESPGHLSRGRVISTGQKVLKMQNITPLHALRNICYPGRGGHLNAKRVCKTPFSHELS